MSRTLSPIVLLCALAISCAGDGKHHSKSADDATDESSENADSDRSSDGERSSRRDDDGDSGGSAEKSKPNSDASAPEPEFTEGMSVDEATKAVPAGIERRNIDQETLGKPLQDVSVYEPCKPGSARVKLKVAVWDGRAVGIDVTTTPKNEKLAGCIKQRISELKWEKKVKSLNTIEYQL
ncbi:MAG: hypothetical protein ACOY0T_17935 [Myxococcota bacterium]